jgi:hypothetical protein
MKKKKRGKKINIHVNINLSNRWFYTIIIIGILAIIGIGVYAYGTSNPSIFGHSLNELERCAEGQTLIVNESTWICVDFPGATVETDPTVKDWAKTDNPNISGKLQAGIIGIGSKDPVSIGSSCSTSQAYELRRCTGPEWQGFICICELGKWRFITAGT